MISHSSSNPFSQPEGSGQQLRHAREAAGLSVEEVAAKLHIAPSVIRSLENQNWACLGAPVFVRGQLHSYASYLGLNPQLIVQQARIGQIEPPDLVIRRLPISRARQWAATLLRKAVYVTITAAFAVPVWFATSHHLQHKALSATSLDTASGMALEESAPSASPLSSRQAPPLQTSVQQAEPTPAAPPTPAQVPAPYVASMTPALVKGSDDNSQSTETAAAPLPVDAGPSEEGVVAHSLDDLVVNFSGDSWFEAASPTGEALAKTLVHSGEQRRYPLAEVAHIVIGNIDSVEVEHGGVPLDLSAFCHGNVARFSISSDGKLY